MEFSPSLECAVILCRSGLGLLMEQISFFFFFLKELPAQDMHVFWFPEDNLSKYQWNLPNLICASILWRSGLRLLMGEFHQVLTELSAQDRPMFSFPNNNLSKC